MRQLKHLFDNNRAWVSQMVASDPDFFKRLAGQQSPRFLWIGCADSRVPANQIVGLVPGDLFVHRNVANLVVHTDLNCLSVIQYAVEVLRVEHIIVCGHYHCGGVLAALKQQRLGLIDNWLRHIHDVYEIHETQLAAITDAKAVADALCELNVVEQVVNLAETTIVADAWQRGQQLSVHGWIYDVADGLLEDLGITVDRPEDLRPFYAAAVARREVNET